jgi:hypothetical protein
MTSYNPDLFSFNIEVHLLKTLFHLCSALVEGIEYLDMTSSGGLSYLTGRGDQYGYNQNPYTIKGTASATTGTRFTYDVEFWKRIPASVSKAQEYLTRAIGRMINNQDLYSKAISNLSMFNYSAESGHQTTLCNSIFCPSTTGELSQSCCTALEMSFLLLALLIQAFDSTDKSIRLHVNDVVRRCKLDAAVSLNEYEQVNRVTMSFRPGSVHNKASVPGNFSARRNDDEEPEDRVFLAFIRKYFPVNA